MKMIKLVLGITLFLSCFKCFAQQNTANQFSKFDSLQISINLILEDAATNHYVLDWKDSLGIYQNNILIDKLYELHCYISDATGLIGSYHGLSTSFSFCNLHTKDSVIDVVFILAADFNSRKARDSRSSPDTAWLNTRIEFEKIRLPVKRIDSLNLLIRKRKKEEESDAVIIKNTCTKKRTIILSQFNKRNREIVIKNGQLLKLNLRTGDTLQLKNGSLNYTHVANKKSSIYLCSNNITR